MGLVAILFLWLVVGSAASSLVAFALGGREGNLAFNQLDFSGLGLIGGFLAINAGFSLFFFVGILIAVSLVHRRHPRTLITAREQISWLRVGQGHEAIGQCTKGVTHYVSNPF